MRLPCEEEETAEKAQGGLVCGYSNKLIINYRTSSFYFPSFLRATSQQTKQRKKKGNVAFEFFSANEASPPTCVT